MQYCGEWVFFVESPMPSTPLTAKQLSEMRVSAQAMCLYSIVRVSAQAMCLYSQPTQARNPVRRGSPPSYHSAVLGKNRAYTCVFCSVEWMDTAIPLCIRMWLASNAVFTL